MFPVRMIHPHMQPLAPLFAVGQVLDQQATCYIAVSRLRDCDADQGRYLLRTGEIVFNDMRDGMPFQRHDALIPLSAHSQIESHSHKAFAEESLQ